MALVVGVLSGEGDSEIEVLKATRNQASAHARARGLTKISIQLEADRLTEKARGGVGLNALTCMPQQIELALANQHAISISGFSSLDHLPKHVARRRSAVHSLHGAGSTGCSFSSGRSNGVN
jgi:hypothetical protein